MTLKTINFYVEGRAFEWCMGISMMAAAIEGTIWPRAVEGSGLLTAYVPNGQTMFKSRLGPYVRAICGVLSAIIWAQFVISLVAQWVDHGYPSPGIPFWFMFTIGELYTAYTTIKNRNRHG